MARRLLPNSDAWGGAWGSASAWGGAWGWSFSPLHEVEEHPEYYGGGRRYSSLDERLKREHHDYLDGLREIQVQVADDVRGAVSVSIPLQMPIPDAIVPRAMRDSMNVLRVVDVLDDPLIIAATALMVIEADD